LKLNDDPLDWILPLTVMFPVLLYANGGGSRAGSVPRETLYASLKLATNIRIES
jgi:hypothetical protein